MRLCIVQEIRALALTMGFWLASYHVISLIREPSVIEVSRF